MHRHAIDDLISTTPGFRHGPRSSHHRQHAIFRPSHLRIGIHSLNQTNRATGLGRVSLSLLISSAFYLATASVSTFQVLFLTYGHHAQSNQAQPTPMGNLHHPYQNLTHTRHASQHFD